MGAWGTGPFENDDASDWSYLLLDGGGAEVVASALQAATEEDVEAPEASVAVGAAAVVAAALGVVVELSDELRAWLAARDDADLGRLRALAGDGVRALDRVTEGSELAELWDEAGDEEWSDRTRRLRAELEAAAGGG